MSRDYTDGEAVRDTEKIQQNANNAEFLRGRMYSLQRIIDNAEKCISGRGGPDDMDRYTEISVATSNMTLCQSLLNNL